MGIDWENDGGALWGIKNVFCLDLGSDDKVVYLLFKLFSCLGGTELCHPQDMPFCGY